MDNKANDKEVRPVLRLYRTTKDTPMTPKDVTRFLYLYGEYRKSKVSPRIFAGRRA